MPVKWTSCEDIQENSRCTDALSNRQRASSAPGTCHLIQRFRSVGEICSKVPQACKFAESGTTGRIRGCAPCDTFRVTACGPAVHGSCFVARPIWSAPLEGVTSARNIYLGTNCIMTLTRQPSRPQPEAEHFEACSCACLVGAYGIFVRRGIAWMHHSHLIRVPSLYSTSGPQYSAGIVPGLTISASLHEAILTQVRL